MDGWIYSVLYLAALLTIKEGPGFYFLITLLFHFLLLADAHSFVS